MKKNLIPLITTLFVLFFLLGVAYEITIDSPDAGTEVTTTPFMDSIQADSAAIVSSK